ncbi:hypothetical protein [Hydrogenophaga intermedia]|uniref:hypothetical protein n=1 Tax=Hydrogenophaga intermedia TaxID=65786 RepID=UPI002042E93D|nr:hypothetical protein [Hydrogenophaga intermedia]MCM3565918.1 hypothetical protein [Hydrogenophaga intermedia]
MKAAAIIPKPTEIGREALIVIGGAIVAALVMSQLPGLRAWIARQWGDAPRPF